MINRQNVDVNRHGTEFSANYITIYYGVLRYLLRYYLLNYITVGG